MKNRTQQQQRHTAWMFVVLSAIFCFYIAPQANPQIASVVVRVCVPRKTRATQKEEVRQPRERQTAQTFRIALTPLPSLRIRAFPSLWADSLFQRPPPVSA